MEIELVGPKAINIILNIFEKKLETEYYDSSC